MSLSTYIYYYFFLIIIFQIYLHKTSPFLSFSLQHQKEEEIKIGEEISPVRKKANSFSHNPLKRRKGGARKNFNSLV